MPQRLTRLLEQERAQAHAYKLGVDAAKEQTRREHMAECKELRAAHGGRAGAGRRWSR